MWPGVGVRGVGHGLRTLALCKRLHIGTTNFALLGFGSSGSIECGCRVQCKKKHTPIEMGVFFSYRKEVGRWLALCGKFRKTTQVGTHLGGKKENHHRTAAQM